jgi:hypothetical protein
MVQEEATEMQDLCGCWRRKKNLESSISLQGWTAKRNIKITAKKCEETRQFLIQLEVEQRKKEMDQINKLHVESMVLDSQAIKDKIMKAFNSLVEYRK